MIQFNAKISRQAQGLDKAPVVLKGASVLNVFTDEWVKADIAIHDDTIIGVEHIQVKQNMITAVNILCPDL